jgi:hypothetical protein
MGRQAVTNSLAAYLASPPLCEPEAVPWEKRATITRRGTHARRTWQPLRKSRKLILQQTAVNPTQCAHAPWIETPEIPRALCSDPELVRPSTLEGGRLVGIHVQLMPTC